jgi:hypothetical protein
MPLNRKACLAAILTIYLLESTNSTSAKPFRFLPGYVVNNTGDTVRCDIDYKDWRQSPTNISARVNGETRSYTSVDIAAFGVTGYDDFKSARVTYHTQPTTGNSIPDEFSDSVETKSLFLKIVVGGPFSLYEIHIPGRYVFFISQPNSGITELVYRVKLVDQIIREDQQFRNLLLNILTTEGIAEANLNLINKITYNLSDIQELIERLNTHRSGKTARISGKRTLFQLDIFGGAIMHSFPTEFNAKYSSYQFSSVVNPAGGLNLLLRFPYHFGSLAIGLSAGYSQFNLSVDRSGTKYFYESANYNDTARYTEHVSLQQKQIQANIYVMYFFMPRSHVQPYLKSGISEHFSLNADNGINETFKSKTTGIRNGAVPTSDSAQGTVSVLSLKNSYFNLNVAAGIIIGKHKLELNAEIPPGNIGPFDNAPFKITTFGFCYFYTLLK